MTPAEAEALVPIAAELIATIRDYSVEDVAAVLDRVPDHRALAVVLAAMVDPDARPSQLLAWTQLGPVPSRSWESPIHLPHLRREPCPECGRDYKVSHLSRHRKTHEQVAS